MIVETQLVGQAYAEHELPDLALELRTALGAHELQLRRVHVRLRHDGNRHSCTLNAVSHQGRSFTIEERSPAVGEAVSLGIRQLLQAVAGERAMPAADVQKPVAPTQRSGRALLLALPACGYPSGSLERARQLASQTGMALHVARILPAPRHLADHTCQSPLVWHTREAGRLLAACRETRAWCDLILAERLPALHVAVRAGEFVSEITRHALQLGTELICVPPMRGRSGSLVAALARATGMPVLVARSPGPRSGMLAAADLQDETYPVVRKAAELARAVTSDVLLLHNLDATLGSHESTMTLDQAEMQRQRLLRAARRWQTGGKVVVTRESDSARAIVKQAASNGVETIVVGTRASPWLARRMARTVAAKVVETAERSVLVVPIAAHQANHTPGTAPH